MNLQMLDELDIDREQMLDLVEEMQLRTWARRNYLPSDERDDNLHPVVLDEMGKKDLES